jgi:hypothetical protein
VIEFDALFATAVRYSDRLDARHLRLTLTGDAGLEATVRDLTVRETECCSFFSFTVTAVEPGQVVLDIDVPAGHVGVLDALASRASTLRPAS